MTICIIHSLEIVNIYDSYTDRMIGTALLHALLGSLHQISAGKYSSQHIILYLLLIHYLCILQIRIHTEHLLIVFKQHLPYSVAKYIHHYYYKKALYSERNPLRSLNARQYQSNDSKYEAVEHDILLKRPVVKDSRYHKNKRRSAPQRCEI